MDYVTRQFINLTKKLRRDLRKSLEALHHNVQNLGEAIRNANEARDKQEQVSKEWRDEVLAKYDQSETSRTASDNRQYSVHNSIRWATWIAAISAAGALGSGCLYAYLSYRQWQTAKDALKAQTRPWIGVSLDSPNVPHPPSHPLGDASTVELDFMVNLHNYGHSPALNVFADFEPIKHHIPREWPSKRDGCMKQSNRQGMGDVVFPGEDGIFRKKSGIFIRANTMNYIVACITYQDGISTYHTVGLFLCADKDGNGVTFDKIEDLTLEVPIAAD